MGSVQLCDSARMFGRPEHGNCLQDNTPSKEQVIFLVDAHQSMFETFRTSEVSR